MKSYVREIDGLRAIAVVAVLLFHAYPGHVRGGFVGVDIFFVISGFIITKTYFDAIAERRTTIGHFFVKRVRRLMPAYALVLIASTVCGYFVLTPINLKVYSESLVAQPAYLQNVVFWHQGDYFEAAWTKPLLHTWSLAVEEQFYFAYAIFLLVVRRFRRIAIPLLVCAIVVSFVLGRIVSPISPKTAFYLLPSRLWELGLGVLVARLPAARLPEKVLRCFQWAAFVFVVVSIVAFGERAPFPGLQTILACAGTAILLVGFASVGAPRGLSTLFGNRGSVWIGQLSYSLYLWHWPVISLWSMAVGHRIGPLEATAALAITMVLSVASYELVETPVRRSRMLVANRTLLFVAGVDALLVAAVAILFLRTDGGSFRYPPDVARLFVAAEHRSPYRCGTMNRLSSRDREMCKIGGPATGSAVLVFGDSHADVLDEVIAEVMAKQNRPTFMTKRPCRLEELGVTRECGDDVIAALREDIKNENIRTIFAFSYLSETHAPPWPRIEKSAALLAESVDRLVLMPDVPRGDVFHPLLRAKRLLAKQPLAEGMPIAEYQQDLDPQLAALRAIAAAHPHIEVIDPSPWLCTSALCPFTAADGEPTHFDDHHLSPSGAKELVPMFEKVASGWP